MLVLTVRMASDSGAMQAGSWPDAAVHENRRRASGFPVHLQRPKAVSVDFTDTAADAG